LSSLFLSRDGRHLIALDHPAVQIWDVVAGKVLARGVLPEGDNRSAVFSPEGSAVAAWGGRNLSVWSLKTGCELFPPLKHLAPVQHAEFSPDGSKLVSCCADNSLNKFYAQIWKLPNGQPAGERLMHDDGVLWATFSSDGRRVATAGEDFSARVWDAATGRQLIPKLEHAHQVQMVVFGDNDASLLTASSDRTARIWSAETGDPLTAPFGHLLSLRTARFLPGGRWIITSDRKEQAWLWEIPRDERPIEDLRAIARLLSGSGLASAGTASTSMDEPIEALWLRLRAKYPSAFTTSAEEITAWHEMEAAKSELEQDWFAEAFHLKRLLEGRPGDPVLSERLARVNEKQPKNNPAP
jgi:WD40 repeat protein